MMVIVVLIETETTVTTSMISRLILRGEKLNQHYITIKTLQIHVEYNDKEEVENVKNARTKLMKTLGCPNGPPPPSQ